MAARGCSEMADVNQLELTEVDLIKNGAAHRASWFGLRESRYGLTLILVLAALLSTLALQHLEDGRPTLFLFFAAVTASAWFGGLSAGILAAILSVPAGLHFYAQELIQPELHLENILLPILLTVCALTGSLLSTRQRAAQEGLQTAHRQLQAKAEQLQATNSVLLSEIADRKRAEHALQEAQEHLTRVARLTTMGELAASIAHEINQPLTAVVTNAGCCLQWLKADPSNVEEARKAAERIIRDGGHASAVIARIRGMLKQGSVEKTELDINMAIEDVLALMQNELRKNRITVRTDLMRLIPRFLGDRSQLQQVFMNLFMNAAEAMSSVSGRARELIIRSGVKDGAIHVEVQDSGEGPDPNILETIFDAFVTTKPAGMGLGLAICRSIIESHCGRMSVSRAAPFGAVFEISLPHDGD